MIAHRPRDVRLPEKLQPAQQLRVSKAHAEALEAAVEHGAQQAT